MIINARSVWARRAGQSGRFWLFLALGMTITVDAFAALETASQGVALFLIAGMIVALPGVVVGWLLSSVVSSAWRKAWLVALGLGLLLLFKLTLFRDLTWMHVLLNPVVWLASGVLGLGCWYGHALRRSARERAVTPTPPPSAPAVSADDALR